MQPTYELGSPSKLCGIHEVKEMTENKILAVDELGNLVTRNPHRGEERKLLSES